MSAVTENYGWVGDRGERAPEPTYTPDMAALIDGEEVPGRCGARLLLHESAHAGAAPPQPHQGHEPDGRADPAGQRRRHPDRHHGFAEQRGGLVVTSC